MLRTTSLDLADIRSGRTWKSHMAAALVVVLLFAVVLVAIIPSLASAS